MPATPAGATVGGGGPKYFKPERSPGRATALVVGGVVALVVVVALAFTLLKGGGGGAPATHSTPPANAHAATAPKATVSNPAELAVTVLNGTETTGLAHHLAAALQQGGYAHASASAAVPPGGAHANTVVEYVSGHRADGQAVAKALNVTNVQAIEGSVASLTSGATVVVVAGADQAALLDNGTQSGGSQGSGEAGGSDVQSNGEATGGGEASAAGAAPAGETANGAGEAGTG
ncbi:MAG TPA: LytR C-terminal domain-containing protein [Solirubrobacteraceae bacterium]|nr:LytR C-terminal domain-containing protein [Solirubrobacteraceae bacterium]